MAASTNRSFEYLEQLPGLTFQKLYQQPSTALAIFRRMLPDLAKCLVMALLYMRDPLPAADLELWVKAESKKERDHAISILGRLHIMTNTMTSNQVRAYMVTNPFASSLRQALTGAENSQSFGVPCSTPDPNAVSIADLDEYARRQWEGVLGYMVGTSGPGVRETVSLSRGVKQLLQAGHLVEIHHGRVDITQDGFAFVLQDVNTQQPHSLPTPVLLVTRCQARYQRKQTPLRENQDQDSSSSRQTTVFTHTHRHPFKSLSSHYSQRSSTGFQTSSLVKLHDNPSVVLLKWVLQPTKLYPIYLLMHTLKCGKKAQSNPPRIRLEYRGQCYRPQWSIRFDSGNLRGTASKPLRGFCSKNLLLSQNTRVHAVMQRKLESWSGSQTVSACSL
uniref:RNA polymerase II transcription factor B subunit 2 n=1 Tax=Talaromyces marneffei PM1 TaxID=1077442 RepID=A0A093V3G6_TALMA